MRKVFLSSTFKDLTKYREIVCDAIEGLDGFYCVRMEVFGARYQESAAFCQAKVAECDLFVGIIGHFYGSSPTWSEKSYTEFEYDVARESDVPCLMFVAPDDFDLPSTLREPDELWQRQKTFRDRIRQNTISDTFSSPEDLAFRVTKAIRNWESDQLREGDEERQQPWQRARYSQDRRPDLGTLVSKMCDRIIQENEFSEFFSFHIRKHLGMPQLYLLPGDESERPDSLVDRFAKTSIQDYANYKWSEQKAAITEKAVDWPYNGVAAQRQKRLMSSLFKQFDSAYEFAHDDFSPQAFIQLKALMLNPVVVLTHEIRAAQWNQNVRHLLGWYFQFWDAVGKLGPKPQFLIFFSIIYPPVANRSWRNLFRLTGFDKKRVEEELNQLCKARLNRSDGATPSDLCPCLLFDELSCVERDEVMNWFRRHKIYDDWNVWNSKCDDIFKRSDCLKMADVEYQLKLVQQEFIKKRGQL